MAARKKAHHNDSCREKIKTSQLINRLQNHVLRKTKLSRTQIQAIKILLAKTLPDLKSIEHTGAVDMDLTVTKIVEEIVN